MLKTLIVDDNAINAEFLQHICMDSPDLEVIGAFQDPLEALVFAKENPVDFALLDVEMPQMNGLDLGKSLRTCYPSIILIYVTGHDEYCKDFTRMKADFSVLKPYTRKDILDAIERAKLLAQRSKKMLDIRAFGHFAVFWEGRAIHFSNAKSKELLALCVDRRGADVLMQEAIERLWPGRPFDDRTKRLYRKAVMDLHKTLREHTESNAFINYRGKCKIDPECIRCDYFDFCEDPRNFRGVFQNEYMYGYPWADETLATLIFACAL